MTGKSAKLRRELEDFKRATGKLGEKINEVSDIWKDAHYESLSSQIGELAKSSRDVIESGERACSCIEKFANIVVEDV